MENVEKCTMNINKYILKLLIFFSLMACQEQNQHKRTEEVIKNYLDAIWVGNMEKAEDYISTPLDDGVGESIDSLKQKQMIFDNLQSMKHQKAYLNRNYPQKPSINISSIFEKSVNLLGKETQTGILICTIELNQKDTCIFMIYNGLNAKKAKIGQVIFKNSQKDFLEIRTH